MSPQLRVLSSRSSSACFGSCGACGTKLSTDRNPQLLPCLHSLCKDCIQPKDGSRECPVCGGVYTLQQVTANLLTESISKSGPQASKCGGCEEPAVFGWCVECGEALCLVCVAAHRRVRMTRDHTVQAQMVTSGSGRTLFCPVHKEEPFKIYCLTCDQLTCRDCQLIFHRNHKFQFAHEAMAAQGKQLQRLMERVRQQKETVQQSLQDLNGRLLDLEELQTRVKQEVKEAIVSIRNTLVMRAVQLVREMQVLCGKEAEGVLERLALLRKLEGRQEYVLAFTQRALDTEDYSALLSCKRQIQSQLQDILAQVAHPPSSMLELKFQCNEDAFSQSLLGKLVAREIPFACPKPRNISKEAPDLLSQTPGLIAQNTASTNSPPTPAPEKPSPPSQKTHSHSHVTSPSQHRSSSSQQLLPLNRSNSFPQDASHPPLRARLSLASSQAGGNDTQVPKLKRPWSYHPYYSNNARHGSPAKLAPLPSHGQASVPSTLPVTHTSQASPVATHPPTLYHYDAVMPFYPGDAVGQSGTPCNDQKCPLLRVQAAACCGPARALATDAPNALPSGPPHYGGPTGMDLLRGPVSRTMVKRSAEEEDAALLARSGHSPPVKALADSPCESAPPAGAKRAAGLRPAVAVETEPTSTVPDPIREPPASEVSVYRQPMPAGAALQRLCTQSGNHFYGIVSMGTAPTRGAAPYSTIYTVPVLKGMSNIRIVLTNGLGFPVATSRSPVNRRAPYASLGTSSGTGTQLCLTADVPAADQQTSAVLAQVGTSGAGPGRVPALPREVSAGRASPPPVPVEALALPAELPAQLPMEPQESEENLNLTVLKNTPPVHLLEPLQSIEEPEEPEEALNLTVLKNPLPVHLQEPLQPLEVRNNQSQRYSESEAADLTDVSTQTRVFVADQPPADCKAVMDLIPITVTAPPTPLAPNPVQTSASDEMKNVDDRLEAVDLTNSYCSPLEEDDAEGSVNPENGHEKGSCKSLGPVERHLLPEVSVYRMPIPIDPSGGPLPRFRLLPGGKTKQVLLQMIQEDEQTPNGDSEPRKGWPGGLPRSRKRKRKPVLLKCPLPGPSEFRVANRTANRCSLLTSASPDSTSQAVGADAPPLLAKKVHCASCRIAGKLTLCCVCGRAFHRDCHIPPILTLANTDQWQCLLCRDLSDGMDLDCMDSEGSPCLSWQDQKKCEYLLLVLTCKKHSSVLYRSSQLSSRSSHYIDITLIRGRLLRKLAPPYRTPSEFVSDVWLLLNTLLNSPKETQSVEQLQKVFSKQLGKVFGQNLHPTLMNDPHSKEGEEVKKSVTESEGRRDKETLKRIRDLITNSSAAKKLRKDSAQ